MKTVNPISEKCLFLVIRFEILCIFLLGCGAAYFVRMHHIAHSEYLLANEVRYQSYLLADQLRQSSDDLPKMVRSYVSTGDSRFEQYFWDILAIRNGQKARPEKYNRIYWDLLLEGKEPGLTGNEKAVALEQLMHQAGFTEEEFALLQKAQKRSDKLVALENMAMHAMKGEFKDLSGNFSKSGPSDPDLARQIVFGDEYYRAKEAIMSPINEFFDLIEQRTAQNVKVASDRITYYFKSIISTGIAFSVFGFLLLLTIRKYQKGLITKLQGANRKQAEELSRRTRAEAKVKLREQVINASSAVAFLWKNEKNWPVEYVSENVSELLGYSAEELIAGLFPYSTIVHPEDLERISNEVKHYSSEPDREKFEHKPYRIITSTGQTKWISDYTSIKRDTEGNITHFMGIILDISKQKTTENLLENIARVLSTSTGIVFAQNLVSQICQTLDTRCAMLLRLLPDNRCQSLASVKDGEPQENTIFSLKNSPYEQILSSEQLHSVSSSSDDFPENDWFCGNGIEHVLGIPLRDSDEHICGLLVTMDNKAIENEELAMSLMEIFASRASAELARVEREKQLQLSANVLANINEGVVVTDVAGNIVAFNAAATRITGYEEKEIIGRNPRLWKSNRHDPSFYKKIWQTVDETMFWSGEIWNCRKNGEVYPCQMTITALKNEQGKLTNYVSMFSDITQVKDSQAKLEQMAQYDQLTMLPNRHLLNDRIGQALIMASRRKHSLGVLLLDLDGFKAVNDSLGHKYGDLLLQKVAQRLVACVRESDTVSRMGGDEFVVLLPDCRDAENVSRIAEKILQTLSNPVHIEEEEIFISASIGITIAPADGVDADTLLKNADTAMYYVKENGKSGFQFFTASMQEQIIERLQLTRELRYALQRNEFLVHYQPKMDIASGRINGMEALVRWQQPNGSIIPPDQFIPLAEETGLIVELGIWIMEQACLQTKKWKEEGLGSLRVSVNLSARQFQDENLVQTVKDLLLETDLDAGMLELEITETTVMQDIEQTIEKLWELRSLGVLLSIDDFGTGYSSMNYLKRLPCDILKIDRSFVMDITTDPSDRAVVEAIVSLSRHMKMKVVAEGVESKEQLAFLKKEQCHEVQGYYISRPLPAAEFSDFIRKHNKI